MTLPFNANLVSNPSFKDGIDGWEPLDSTIELVATGGYGNNEECLRVTKTIEEYSGVQSTRTISINNRGESNKYSASAYVKIPSGDDNGTLRLSILWYTSGKTYISSSDSTATAVTAGGAWQRLTKANVTPPTNARYAAIRIVQTTGGNAGETFLVDAVKLEVGTAVTAFQEFIDQGQETSIVNRGLTKVPVPHLTGMQLNADIELGDLVLNTIDNEGYVYVVTDITGVFGTPESEFAEMSRGTYRDGDYETRGRYRARYITLTGSILVPGPEYVAAARDKIIRAADLVRSGTWLKLKPANEPVKAMHVRLNGSVDTVVVNPRGRVDFSIGLKAADPVLYEWNEERTDGYYVANVYSSNYSGSEVGSVEIGTNGNYTVGAIYEVRGPIVGDNATVFNYTNGNLDTITGSIRGERYKTIKQKKLEDYVATLNFVEKHDFEVGDELYVSLANSIAVANVARGSGNTYATIGAAYATAYCNNDKVVLSGVDSSLDGQLLTISNVSGTTFTVPSSNTTALSNTSLSSATANNYTNDLLNGTRVVVATTNNKSISYYVESRDSIVLTNVINQNKASMRNAVYRDADYLEINTSDNDVALNGTVSGARGLLDAIIDWVKLEAGSNIIELDDSGQLPLYVESRSIDENGYATLKVSSPHGLEVGDNIHVEYVGEDYNTPGRAAITYYSQDAYEVTITATSHGFSVGDTVVVSSVSRDVDGMYVLTYVSTNTFRYTVDTSATVYQTKAAGIAKKIMPVTHYAKSNTVVTLSTEYASSFTAGQAIYVTGVHEEADGQWWVSNSNVAANTISYYTNNRKAPGKIVTTAAPTGAQVSFRFPITATTDYTIRYKTNQDTVLVPETNVESGMLAWTEEGGFASINAYSRTANVATVTTTTKHGYSAGQFVTVSGTANTAFNVATGNQVNVLSYAISGSTVTMIANTHNLVANDTATIYGIDTGVSGVDINGTYRVVSVPNVNAITYNLDSSQILQYTTTGMELVNNMATIYLKSTPEFDATDADGNATNITVGNLGSPFDGTFDVVGVQVQDNTITYSVTNANVAYAADTDGIVYLNYSKNPERAFLYQKNEVMFYNINASINTYTNTVTGTYAHLRTENAHGLAVGDTVEITGVSAIIDGIRKIVDTSQNSFMFTVEIENSSIVQRKTATGVRSTGKTTVTLTLASHGLSKGDWIYFDSQSAATLAGDGKYEVKSVIDANKFTITGNLSGAEYTATTTHYWWPLRQNAYATKAFPILSAPAPTDYTFSYSNPCTTATVANTAVTRSGEVTQQSDARMKVYYRSGWIG
jgi:hypothetical protein